LLAVKMSGSKGQLRERKPWTEEMVPGEINSKGGKDNGKYIDRERKKGGRIIARSIDNPSLETIADQMLSSPRCCWESK